MTETGVPVRAGRRPAGFRVPALVATRAGDLLAFREGRVGSRDDFGNIDVVLKRSTDGGRTWGPLQAAARNGDSLAGNSAQVVLGSGRVLLVHVRNAALATEDAIRRGTVSAADGRRAWVRHSDDERRTWSEPREITRETKRPEWRWYATTPGHAIRLTKGRVVVPANQSLPPTGTDDGTEGRHNGGHCLLSDDADATWRIGYVDDDTDGCINANETTAAELPDGRVYFNTRNDSLVRHPGPAPTRPTADGPWRSPSARRPDSPPPSARPPSSNSATPTCSCTPAPPTRASAP